MDNFWKIGSNEGIACNSRIPCIEMLKSSATKLKTCTITDNMAITLIPALKNVKSSLPFYKSYPDYKNFIDDIMTSIRNMSVSVLSQNTLKNILGNYDTLKASTEDDPEYNRYLGSFKSCIDYAISELKDPDTIKINDLLKDYNRIVYSSSFRRLQHKAQVFSLEKYDYVRTRLTHTIEVSSIAADLGNVCAQQTFDKKPYNGTLKKTMQFQFEKICAAAALLHDIGNPPFGHLGERAIRNYFKENWNILTYNVFDANDRTTEKLLSDFYFEPDYEQMKNDFCRFDGNAQSFRVAAKIPTYKPDHSSELSASILGAMIKYPNSSVAEYANKNKFGYYYSEKDRIAELSVLGVYCEGKRNPLAYLVEVADDISYVTSDFDDIVKKGILTYENFADELSQIEDDETDAELLNFKNNFYRYYNENLKQQDMMSPFELTIQRMTNDLRLQLIKTVARVFTSSLSDSENGFLFELNAETTSTDYSNLIERSDLDKLVKWIKNLFVKYVYSNRAIIATELSGYSILYNLMDSFVKCVLSLNFNLNDNNFGFEKDSSDNIAKEKRIFGLFSDNFVELFKNESSSFDTNSLNHIYYRLRLVVDYVSGMTDTYAKEIYQIINGIA